MKEVDLKRNRLVVAGKVWEYERSPCCKDMIHHLVRRECYCSWFQPVGGGVKDQFPAIRIGELYYTLSLRIQKAMFRHVRLTKDFKNLERLPDGQVKLRIPTQLLVEKKRTATRFTVRRGGFAVAGVFTHGGFVAVIGDAVQGDGLQAHGQAPEVRPPGGRLGGDGPVGHHQRDPGPCE